MDKTDTRAQTQQHNFYDFIPISHRISCDSTNMRAPETRFNLHKNAAQLRTKIQKTRHTYTSIPITAKQLSIALTRLIKTERSSKRLGRCPTEYR